MKRSVLEEVVDKSVATGTVGAFSRAAEVAGEKLARELLREPEFRDRMKALLRAAFDRALTISPLTTTE